MSERGIESVTLEYEGAIAELNVKPLTAIALTALLRGAASTASTWSMSASSCRERKSG